MLALPEGIEDGEKEAVAPVGSPITVNDTVFAVAAFVGTIMSVKFAGWPATVVLLGVEAVTLKSSTINVSADVVPPPGVGLLTVMLNPPL